jgi:hypothetical protein
MRRVPKLVHKQWILRLLRRLDSEDSDVVDEAVQEASIRDAR